MAPVTRTRLRLNGRPTASATAMPCASMPTEPSVMIQVFSPRAFCGDGPAIDGAAAVAGRSYWRKISGTI